VILVAAGAPAIRAVEVPSPPPPSVAPSPSPSPSPQIAFPGQYALAPSDWRFPTWPAGCGRFAGEEKAACLEFVAFDFGRLSRFAAANALLAPPAPGEHRVVFYGDSITDNWSKGGYGGFFVGKPYVNRGIGGQTTAQMLVRFRPDVLDLHPEVVVILAGTNDIAGNAGPVRAETVEQNLASMAELAVLHGVKVVLSSILPVADDKTDAAGHPLVRTTDRRPATIRALNEWMTAYAHEHGHVYLDYVPAVSDPTGAFRRDLNFDGLHPNAAGYAVMAPLAESAIEKALASPR
jgi:lysophospholipase L1-like esterase